MTYRAIVTNRNFYRLHIPLVLLVLEPRLKIFMEARMHNIKKYLLLFVPFFFFSTKPMDNPVSRLSTFATNFWDVCDKDKLEVTGGLLIGAGAVAYGTHLWNQKYRSNLYWNWKTINTNNLAFPHNFLWGAGTSAHQIEEDCDNNSWSSNSPWASQLQNKKDFVFPGKACEGYSCCFDDIQLLKDIGCNAYRFSVEWSKIEPQLSKFDNKVLQHYADFCDALIKNNIKPVITIHHYTDPIWFLEKGGFEKEENIGYFVEFCEKLSEALAGKVHMYLTFNSPSGYAMPSYLLGDKPPFKKDMHLAATVLKNMLETHVQVYKEIKKQDSKVQVGILKNIYQLDPWRIWHPVDRLFCYMGKKLVDDCFFDFFNKGTFNVSIPFKVSINHENKNAPKSLDFIGLNYYGHTYFKSTQRFHPKWEEKTANENYYVYPEGLYRAINELNNKIALPLQIPIYVTENGIGTDDNAQRERHMKRYLYAISKAIQDGANVKGYFYWSLMDNYEWGNYNAHFGLYHVDFETQKRTLKEGAQYYPQVTQSYNEACRLQTSSLVYFNPIKDFQLDENDYGLVTF